MVYTYNGLLLFSRSVVSDSFGTLWTLACQAPLSMGFPRQEYWSLDPGIKSMSPAFLALAGGVFSTESLRKPLNGLLCMLSHLSRI